ncbi:CD209 antigen-like protein C isoform X2 [Oncorhynchus nerka]|uniref:CD209 antigen-like protein C isoform X2 n=1 Tax=Oncorhynchus nerka TaxID=8023 RepID=UPI0031B880AF
MEMSEDIVYANEDVRGKQSVSGDHFYNRGDDIYEDIYETPDTIKFNDFRNKTEVTPRSRPGAKLSDDRVYNNLTEERDQLQTRYNNLTEERDQLQTSYNNLTEERDQLQTSYNNLTEERDLLVWRAERSGCPVGWRKFDCSCYFLSIVSKTWEESRQDCLNRGGDLVIIQSREEQDHIKTFKVMSWIGLTDEDSEGLWTWVNNTQLTTAEYWHPDEPNGGREENCGMIQMNYDAWNDTSCSAALPWICEKYAYC